MALNPIILFSLKLYSRINIFKNGGTPTISTKSKFSPIFFTIKVYFQGH